MGGLQGQRHRAPRKAVVCTLGRWLARGACAIAASGLGAGCAANGLSGQELHTGEFDLRVGPVAPGWRPIRQPGSLLAFRDDLERATVALEGRCGKDGDDVPLAALTRHLFLYFTHQEIISQRAFRLDGREALRTEMAAELDGVPQHFTVVVLKKNGCVYDFLYIEQTTGSATGRSNFDRFVAGFSTLGER